MSDPGPWPPQAGAPYGAPPPPAYRAPAPPYGAPAPPPYGAPPPPPYGAGPAYSPYGAPAPPYGAPQQPYGAPGGWTPPPKPGLVPLRPLTLGDVLGGAFQVLRRNPRPTFGFALVMSLLSTAVTGIVGGLYFAWVFGRIATAGSQDAETIAIGSLVGSGLIVVVTGVLSAAINSLVQGVIAQEVGRAALGERNTFRGLWQGMRGRIGALLAWAGLLVGAALAAMLVVAAFIGILVALAGPEVGLIIGSLLINVLQLGVIVLVYWLMAKLAFVPAAIVLERRRVLDAVRRSWTLTRGHFWRILGILLLTSVILSGVLMVAMIPLFVMIPFAVMLFAPNSEPGAIAVVLIVLGLIAYAMLSIASAITLVAQSAVPALLFVDVRMRKEGLDLDLQRFVEDRAAGLPVPDNPYLVPPGAPYPATP